MKRSRPTKRQGAIALACTGGLLTAVGLAGLGPMAATASSHREAPLISGIPQYDTTDLYAFRSPEAQKTVTLIANWLPFEEPAGGPNFYSFATDAQYDIKIDNNADAKPDVTFRWTFKDHYVSGDTFLAATGPVTSLTDKDLNYYQTYKLVRIKNGKTQDDHQEEARRAVQHRQGVDAQLRRAARPGDDQPRRRASSRSPVRPRTRSSSTCASSTCSTAVTSPRPATTPWRASTSSRWRCQVPQRWVAKKTNPKKNPIIGTWSTTQKKSTNGKWVQVSRLGAPLVNEVVIPLKLKDAFNGLKPTGDAAALEYVTNPELPKLIEAVYGIDAPKTPRNDLVSVFLTGVEGLNMPKGKITPSEQLRLNMSTPVTATPNRLGVIGGDTQGFPNGRRLGDDVIDIALQVVEGELVGSANDLGDGVNTNDVAFSNTFPYLALPASGSNADPHPSAGGSAKQSSSNGLLQGIVPSRSSSMAFVGVGLLALLGGIGGATRRRKA